MTEAASTKFHREWLGKAQPYDGLVVSVAALDEANCFERLRKDAHEAFLAQLEELEGKPFGKDAEGPFRIRDPKAFLRELFSWEKAGYSEELPEELSVYFSESSDRLHPTGGVPIPAYAKADASAAAETPAQAAGRNYRLLYWQIPDGLDFDARENQTTGFNYPPARKFERLLHETRVPIGVLCNQRVIRLMYAPAGGVSGYIDFRVDHMAEVDGRPLYNALWLLLHERRLVGVKEDKQLHTILKNSRERQADVTSELGKQVREALGDLLEGFEAADNRTQGTWLRNVMQSEDVELYDALLTVLLRMVFLLYAEQKGLLPNDSPLFERAYSLINLFEELEEDAGRYPDSMNRRFGAWPRLLTMFRLLAHGGRHRGLDLPERRGGLFDPRRFPFLEGFERETDVPMPHHRDAMSKAEPPTVDDGTIHKILRKLIFLKAERLSYKTLDVEQIGSVYEGLMGFHVERLDEPAVRLGKGKITPRWVRVKDLTQGPAAKRKDWIKKETGITGKGVADALKALKKAEDAGDAVAAFEALKGLRSKTAQKKELGVCDAGRLVLQPGEERKRTSSHYTPQSLSGPIVERAIEPLLKCFGELPTSEQILSLKICDPAMGSGAFLVEACRYLGERLLEAWHREGETTSLFSETDDLTTYARRQVAERCLYGVDKNPFAVELAKLSLWLVTLQREKPFTFLDHALRCGDSLVGCSLEQITQFDWRAGIEGAEKNKNKGKGKKKSRSRRSDAMSQAEGERDLLFANQSLGGSATAKSQQLDLFDRELADSLDQAIKARDRIAEFSQHDTPEANREMAIAMRDADDALIRLRLIGDLLIGAFFDEKKDKAREQERQRRKALIEQWLLDDDQGVPPELQELADKTRAELRPFHWMIEFPEVFYAGRPDPLTGKTEDEPAYLDAVIGNPPFLGGRRISMAYGSAPLLDYVESKYGLRCGNADLCTRFFRLADDLIGLHGTTGMIATSKILTTDDSVEFGLGTLIEHGALVYDASSPFEWPTPDADLSVVTAHIVKGEPERHCLPPMLDGVPVETIGARFGETRVRSEPQTLKSNKKLSFQGVIPLGEGFELELEEGESLLANSDCTEIIKPYLGADEVNGSPAGDFGRYIIHFGDRTLEEAENWPELLSIVRERVIPQRATKKSTVGYPWWKFWRTKVAWYEKLKIQAECLVTAKEPARVCFSFQPTNRVFSAKLYAFLSDSRGFFAIMQSRVHLMWAALHGGAHGSSGTPTYKNTTCFETFPFPRRSPKEVIPELEKIGEELYETRAKFMVDTDQGLTKTYNALKDPTVSAPGSSRLRAEAKNVQLAHSASSASHAHHDARTELERIEHLRRLHLDMDRAVLEAYARETGDDSWTQIEIPPFTDPVTDAEKELHQRFEDHVLDKLFELNEIRAKEEAG